MREIDDIISFMDMMDFDEETVDTRLKCIMERNTFTTRHLLNATNLLKYKHLLNVKEFDECDNDYEFEFIGKLIKNIDQTNIDVICKIVDIILSLNPTSIVVKSEHLLQQLLSAVSIHLENITEENYVTILMYLKLCDSILEAVSRLNEKLCLPFLDIPLERIVISQNEELKKHFLTITVKHLFDGVDGYNVLDQIWNCVKQQAGSQLISLRVLCVLSNYYLPLPDSKGVVLFKSNIISQAEFWEVTLYGLLSNDVSTRKLAIYLIKRAIDCLKIEKTNIKIVTSNVSVIWDTNKENETKKIWDNFFILIDSLEEKQSNIVLPSLQLFDSLQELGQCWLSCAYNIGLQHDNLQVKIQCAKYRLQTPILNVTEAIVLLEALNDMNIYDCKRDFELLLQRLKQNMDDLDSFIYIVKNIPKIKWSPVPIYHLSCVLACVYHDKIVDKIGKEQLAMMIYDVLKVQCNNVIIRKAFHRNLSHLIGNCCSTLNWVDILNLYMQLEVDIWSNKEGNPLIVLIKEQLNITDKQQFFTNISKIHFNIDFILLYLSGHTSDLELFFKVVNEMYNTLDNVNENPNNNEIDYVLKATFLSHLLQKTELKIDFEKYLSIRKINNTIIKYALTILCSPVEDVENVLLFIDNLNNFINTSTDVTILEELYSRLISTLKEGSDIHKNIYSISILNILSSSRITDMQFHNKIVDVDEFMQILNNIKLDNRSMKEGNGKLRNIFYSKACEVIFVLLHNQNHAKKLNYKQILNYVELALECGGYSCIKWILNILDNILPAVLKEDSNMFDISSFLSSTWNEIEALKTNRQYTDCIECFVKLITNEYLLKTPMYNNIVITYCSKIVEYAVTKNIPLYYLVDAMGKDHVLKYGHMVYIFSEVLLATAVPRKDQRITENVIVELSKTYDLSNVRSCLYTNFHIKYKSLLVLSEVTDTETLETLATLIIQKIDELFRNKNRYHSNSALHRTLQIGLQHLLFIFLKHRSNYVEKVNKWCIEFLGRIPHQTSIRLYLEWYITLYYYYKGEQITDKILNTLKKKNVPVISQFLILYWLLTHKMRRSICQQYEYDLVMDTLMENTMGPTYSVRLYAQYLTKRIYDDKNISNSNIDISAYTQTVKVIGKTLCEAEKLKEKSFDKLLNDFLVHQFDIVEYLLPCSLYHGEFLHEEWNHEIINEVCALEVFNEMIKFVKSEPNDEFINEWMQTHKCQDVLVNLKSNYRNADLIDNARDEIGTIQKKYIPWKNMSDIDVLEMKRSESKSELIVVASLIDKLPNLGGMARTSEVFGVHTYVIDSVRHLQDKQFQGLSVSAERWVNVIEVRPGQPLKNYLTTKKSEGYTIVAAEQTSSSISLPSYKFPKKTLLLLGHEKEGVPCDLLPYMDACVEIPQQGVVRSLNVHVTAAIFIWEYSRQIIL